MENLNRVHLNGLRALEAAGRNRSLMRTAAELGVSAGAVSQQIIKAEKQLGAVVFERTPKGLEPTPFGQALLARLTAGFRELDGAVGMVGRDSASMLTLSVAPVFASKWLVPRLGRFHRAHPELRVRMESTVDLVDPDRSDIDVAIRVGLGNWPKVKAEFLLPQEVFPVCAPDLAPMLEQPADLAKLPIIRDINSTLDWKLWLENFGLDESILRTGDSFTDAALCLDAAIAGQGVMLAWQTLAHDAMQAGLLVAPFPERVRSSYGYFLITSGTRREPNKVAAFRDWLKGEIARTVAESGGDAGAALG
jgi:LysR family glycine cleavage system transcriptional activator